MITPIADLVNVIYKMVPKSKKLPKNFPTTSGQNSRYSTTIKGRSEEYVLQFPMVASSSLSIDTVETLRNQLELERSFEFLNVITNSPSVKYSSDGPFLADFHTNIRLGEGVSAKDIQEINKNQLVRLEDKVNDVSLNEMSISTFYKKKLNEEVTKLSEADGDEENSKPRMYFGGSLGQDSRINKSFEDKTNSSIPTYIDTKVKWEDENGNVGKDSQSLTFGVKTVTHLVESDDVIFYLSDKSKRSQLLVNLVRFTSGEIRLVRDLLLNTETSRRIASDSRRKRGGKVWNNLNTIYSTDFLKGLTKSRKNIPTTALVVSMDEISEIRRQSGIDILEDRTARAKIYDSLSLLEFIIVDEMNDVVYKYHGARNAFDSHKLSRLGGMKIKEKDKKDGIDGDILSKLLR